MANTYRIYSWNVNGIRAAIKKGFEKDFIVKKQPDIVCLQETKAHQHQVEVDLPDYDEYWHSAEKKGYSGTAIFSKTKPLSVSFGIEPSVVKKKDMTDSAGRDGLSEGRVITAEYEKFYVVSVYTPNAKDDLSRLDFRYKQWDTLFLKYLQFLEKKKPVIAGGDYNVAHQEIDLARPKQNRGKKGFTDEERERFQDFLDAGFVDTFRYLHPDKKDAYSWWSYFGKSRERNVGWRIDYILVSNKLKKNVKKAEIHPDITGSDHCPVSIELSI